MAKFIEAENMKMSTAVQRRSTSFKDVLMDEIYISVTYITSTSSF